MKHTGKGWGREGKGRDGDGEGMGKGRVGLLLGRDLVAAVVYFFMNPQQSRTEGTSVALERKIFLKGIFPH